MSFFLRYLELLFTAAGLVVIAATSAWAASAGFEAWHAAAITATLVGVIHGVIFWLVHRRQRRARRETIQEVQSMLEDLVNNQLGVIVAANDLRASASGDPMVMTGYIRDSAARIAAGIRHLSAESLDAWKGKYETDEPGGN